MARVDIRARCWEGGRKAGVGGLSAVPAVKSEISRFMAGISGIIRIRVQRSEQKRHTQSFFKVDHAMLTKFIG